MREEEWRLGWMSALALRERPDRRPVAAFGRLHAPHRFVEAAAHIAPLDWRGLNGTSHSRHGFAAGLDGLELGQGSLNLKLVLGAVVLGHDVLPVGLVRQASLYATRRGICDFNAQGRRSATKARVEYGRRLPVLRCRAIKT